jgi:hypothetical protein
MSCRHLQWASDAIMYLLVRYDKNSRDLQCHHDPMSALHLLVVAAFIVPNTHLERVCIGDQITPA